jgi:hypothetical protein
MPRVAVFAVATLAGAIVVGCASAAPTGTPSPPATEFTLAVHPPASVGMTIGGQRVVFLVGITGSAADGPVSLRASADGAEISIEPTLLDPGVVGEVTIIPTAVTAERALEVTITATRGGIEHAERRMLTMMPGEGDLEAEARGRLATFTAWLAAEHPELGITPETTFAATPGSWLLVVSHHIFVSEEWELGLSWHVMRPPDDWSELYLRHRWSEDRPSRAFRVKSVAEATEPMEVAPPAEVWR